MSRTVLFLTLVVTAIVILVAVNGADAASTSAQKLHKSTTVVAWYEGEGSWHLSSRLPQVLADPLGAARVPLLPPPPGLSLA